MDEIVHPTRFLVLLAADEGGKEIHLSRRYFGRIAQVGRVLGDTVPPERSRSSPALTCL